MEMSGETFRGNAPLFQPTRLKQRQYAGTTSDRCPPVYAWQQTAKLITRGTLRCIVGQIEFAPIITVCLTDGRSKDDNELQTVNEIVSF